MKYIFVLIISFGIIYANPLEPKNFVSPTQQSLQNNKNANNNYQDLENNRFYLNLTPEEIHSIKNKNTEIQESFDGFYEKEINYKPVIRPIASMDSIMIHPYFTFTILLPEGSVISHIDSSVPMAVLKYENNAVLIRPNSDFKVGNLTILYKHKNINQVLNILANFYQKGDEQEKLNLIYSYKDTPKLEATEVISAYVKEYGSLPKYKYSYIQINDITYRIVEDESYGKIFINNKKYRVDNNTIYK